MAQSIFYVVGRASSEMLRSDFDRVTLSDSSPGKQGLYGNLLRLSGARQGAQIPNHIPGIPEYSGL